jgi:hypothetical protein
MKRVFVTSFWVSLVISVLSIPLMNGSVFNFFLTLYLSFTIISCFAFYIAAILSAILSLPSSGGGSYRGSSSSSSSSSNSTINESVDYKPQRLEGIGWVNCGTGDTSSGGKYACQDIDRMKRAEPKYSYRVVERRSGRIVGTIYSC